MKLKIFILSIVDFILITSLVFIFTQNVFAATAPAISNEEFENIVLLAKVISGEAGADWCSDEMRYGVGSVVVNRVEHEAFPNTYEEVIYQKGQYGCLDTEYFKEFPSEHCIAIAADIIISGNKYPVDVVYQSNEPLGSRTYKHIQNMYFGYI